jgi:ppGpp synthetase/RelA/SpoT-type nucleotidyltranferase
MPTGSAQQQAVEEFAQKRHLYEKLGKVVVADLDQALRDRGLDKMIHGVVNSRVKEIDSFQKKIAHKPYSDPLKETRDLLGVRVVCLYPSLLSEIDEVIQETFEVIRYEDKSKVEKPDLWRYSSVHYDCELPGDNSERRYEDGLQNLVFEIQVRTILQDAWATVEHRLGYKSEREIPDELKREFSALAGLFHIADERFQYIADQIEELKRTQNVAKKLAPLYRSVLLQGVPYSDRHAQATSSLDAKIRELEGRPDAVINRGSLKALLRGMYPNRRPKNKRDYSVLAQDLASAEISSLGELGRLLLKGDNAAQQQEQDQGSLSDVAFARTAISAASPTFRRMRHRSHARQTGKP